MQTTEVITDNKGTVNTAGPDGNPGVVQGEMKDQNINHTETHSCIKHGLTPAMTIEAYFNSQK